MDLFVLAAADRKGGISSKCSFEYSTDGGQSFSPAKKETTGASQFSVPKLGEKDIITVRATPEDTTLWPATGTFQLGPQGSVLPQAAPAEFFLVAGTVRAGVDSTTFIYFFMSPFRDVTDETMKKLLAPPEVTGPERRTKNRANYPKRAYKNWPPTSWSAPTLDTFSVISQDVISGSDVSFGQGAGSATTIDRVLERKGDVLPKTMVVCWPKALARTVDSPPTPFLVFFTHLLNQNLSELFYYNDYPYGWDYLFFAMLTYLNYSADPLDLDGGGDFSRGLLYQVGASGKSVVLVLPVGNARVPKGEVGDCLKAELLSGMLEEIQAFFFRQAGLFRAPKPEVGRVAMGSFSSGNNQVNAFLASNANKASDFYLNVLKEVYCFDTPHSFAPAWAAFALQWAQAGSAPEDKVIRMYGTHQPTFEGIHKALLNAPPPATAPYVSTPAGMPNRTVAVLPEASWRAAVKKPSVNPMSLAQDVHQLMVGTLLTDALRRSKF